MTRTRGSLLLLLVTLGFVSGPMSAEPTCARGCAPRLAECKRSRCGGLAGRACLDLCRVETGCAAGAAPIRTLAYVANECHSSGGRYSVRQRIEIRRGGCAPLTLLETTWSEAAADPLDICRVYGELGDGTSGVVAGVFHRFGVSPDGHTVVFEVTDRFRVLAGPPPPVEAGIYRVGADGRGLRRLRPASNDASFRVVPATAPPFFAVGYSPYLTFSPDGSTVALSDLGPDPGGAQAVQIVTLDVASGRQTQVTQLAATSQTPTTLLITKFLGDRTLLVSVVDTAMDRPRQEYTVKTDGTDMEELQRPVAVPGSQIVADFRLVGLSNRLLTFSLPAMATEPAPGAAREVFFHDRGNLLQLTSFGRSDTRALFAGPDRRRGYFVASADPLGTNPTGNCQLFSVDAFGRRLRQLTRLRDADGRSAIGCESTSRTDCSVGVSNYDRAKGTIIFASSCDPLGINPHGFQVFAMRPSGRALRQLTNLRGLVEEPEGVTVELAGPGGYSGTAF